jgi:Spy/CpxP family protein refolding chaperone
VTTRLSKLAAIAVIAVWAIACSKSDADITTQVKNRLAADEATKSSQIDVTTTDKVVTLAGNVDSAAAKSKAVDLARSADGVSNVVDKLAINTVTAQSALAGSPATAQQPAASGTAMSGMGMMDMHRGEMGMPPEGMMSERGGMGTAAPSSGAPASPLPTARPLSTLPGMPGVSHLYHIGSAGFFLNQPQIQLTTDQQSRLRQIMERALLDRGNADRAIERAEEELWTLTGDGTDAARVEAKIAEIERGRTNQRIEFIRSVGEGIEVLTPEQRTALVGTTAPKK